MKCFGFNELSINFHRFRSLKIIKVLFRTVEYLRMLKSSIWNNNYPITQLPNEITHLIGVPGANTKV